VEEAVCYQQQQRPNQNFTVFSQIPTKGILMKLQKNISPGHFLIFLTFCLGLGLSVATDNDAANRQQITILLCPYYPSYQNISEC